MIACRGSRRLSGRLTLGVSWLKRPHPSETKERRDMLSRLLCCSLAMLALLPTNAVAEGLLYQLPVDGVWARFEMVQTHWKTSGNSIGTLTVSSVGTEEIDGRKCRWIEIDYDTKGWRSPIRNVYKLLIPEEHLGKGGEPLKHVVKAWYKDGKGNPTENKNLYVLVGAARYKLLDSFFHGPFGSATELEAAAIESQLGKLDCKGIAVNETTRLEEELLDGAIYSIRLHEKAPFGVVLWERKLHWVLRTRDGPIQGWETTKLKLAATGIDAKSAMPEAR